MNMPPSMFRVWPGDEGAVGGGQEEHRADEVLRDFVALDGPARPLRLQQRWREAVADSLGHREAGGGDVHGDAVRLSVATTVSPLARKRFDQDRADAACGAGDDHYSVCVHGLSLWWVLAGWSRTGLNA